MLVVQRKTRSGGVALNCIELPLRVNRVTLIARCSLPVFPD